MDERKTLSLRQAKNCLQLKLSEALSELPDGAFKQGSIVAYQTALYIVESVDQTLEIPKDKDG